MQGRPHRKATQVKMLIVMRSKGYSPRVRLTVAQGRVTGTWGQWLLVGGP